jgi:hypothetical protein
MNPRCGSRACFGGWDSRSSFLCYCNGARLVLQLLLFGMLRLPVSLPLLSHCDDLILQSGLGCRVISYIIYASLSTLIWFFIILSAWASYLYSKRTVCDNLREAYKHIALFFRYTANMIAILNTFVLMMAGLFQFSGVYGNCYCDASVLGKGANKAYNIVIPTNAQNLSKIWAVAVGFAGLSVGLYLWWIWLHFEQAPVIQTWQSSRTCEACLGTGAKLTSNVDGCELERGDGSRLISRQATAMQQYSSSLGSESTRFAESDFPISKLSNTVTSGSSSISTRYPSET